MISAALGKTPKEERSLTSQEGVGEWQKEEAKEDGRRQHRGCLSPATSTSPTVGRGAHPARAPAPAHSLKTRAPSRVRPAACAPEAYGSDLGLERVGRGIGSFKISSGRSSRQARVEGGIKSTGFQDVGAGSQARAEAWLERARVEGCVW